MKWSIWDIILLWHFNAMDYFITILKPFYLFYRIIIPCFYVKWFNRFPHQYFFLVRQQEGQQVRYCKSSWWVDGPECEVKDERRRDFRQSQWRHVSSCTCFHLSEAFPRLYERASWTYSKRGQRSSEHDQTGTLRHSVSSPPSERSLDLSHHSGQTTCPTKTKHSS